MEVLQEQVNTLQQQLVEATNQLAQAAAQVQVANQAQAQAEAHAAAQTRAAAQAQEEARRAQAQAAVQVRDAAAAPQPVVAAAQPPAVQAPNVRVQLPKYPQPDQWNGKGDIVREYGVPVKRFLRHYQLENTREGIEYAVPFLPAAYQRMWETYQAAGQALPTTFDDFFHLVRTWCPTANTLQRAMKKMEILRQKKGGIVNYNEEWAWLVMDLQTYVTDYTIKYKYFHGLTLAIQKDIDGKFNMESATLSQIMTLAVESEARQQLYDISGYNRSYNSSTTTSSNGPAPMDIDVNAVKATSFKGKCYKCHKYGHRARDCRNPPSKPAPKK